MIIELTLHWQQILLIVMHVFLLIGMLALYRDMTSGSDDSALIGFGLWIGTSAVFEILIWLLYFTTMYLTSP